MKIFSNFGYILFILHTKELWGSLSLSAMNTLQDSFVIAQSSSRPPLIGGDKLHLYPCLALAGWQTLDNMSPYDSGVHRSNEVHSIHSKVGLMYLRLWHASLVAWPLDILIGQAAMQLGLHATTIPYQGSKQMIPTLGLMCRKSL